MSTYPKSAALFCLLLAAAFSCHKKPPPGPPRIGQPADWLTRIGGGEHPVFDDSRYILLGGYQSPDPKLITRASQLARAGSEKIVWQLMEAFDVQAASPFQEVVVETFDEFPGVTSGHLLNESRVLYFVSDTIVHPPMARQSDGSCLPIPPGLMPTVYFEATSELSTKLGKSAKFPPGDDPGVRFASSKSECDWLVHSYVDVADSAAQPGIPWGPSPLGTEYRRASFDVRMTPWSTKRALTWSAP